MRYYFLYSLFFVAFGLSAQLSLIKKKITHRDSLQGQLTPERTCFDVQRYDINLRVNTAKKHIKGYNAITFKVVQKTKKIQIDLFENLQIDSIIYHNTKLTYTRDALAVFINFTTFLNTDTSHTIQFYYSGNPIIAKNPPWDGGFVYTTDAQNKPWIGVACQGLGASCWIPVKDSQSDEPDQGVSIKVAVPNGLMNVSNGKFIAATNLNNGYTQWHWEVKNPINAYNITINIANYLHIQDTHNGLALDYYVLPENKQIATKHFKQVKPMLDCFEAKFGPYPFTEDGYKLIQTPYLGMEHQSGIAYGNYYQNGYLGQDLSNTGVGLLFDYIIVHESGHEWFGNSITSRDIADLWIHEGFTQYAEIVYIECQYGYQKAMQYANGLKNNIINDQPILGVYGTNTAGSLDCYAKGALLLNTLRHVVNNDKKWWDLILKYSLTYKKQIIDTPTVIAFFNKETQLNLTPIFNAYLKHAAIPKLVTRVYNKAIEYKWQTPETNFEMPLDILINKQKTRIYPTNYWKRLPTDIKNYGNIKPLTHNFYIQYH